MMVPFPIRRGIYMVPENSENLELTSIFQAVYVSVIQIPILLLIPMPWNWTNIFYPMQSIESCLLIYLYLRLSMDQSIYKNYEFILLTFVLLIGLAIYALIMANEGTFVRYRFTLFYPFLLGLFYLSNKINKGIKS